MGINDKIGRSGGGGVSSESSARFYKMIDQN